MWDFNWLRYQKSWPHIFPASTCQHPADLFHVIFFQWLENTLDISWSLYSSIIWCSDLFKVLVKIATAYLSNRTDNNRPRNTLLTLCVGMCARKRSSSFGVVAASLIEPWTAVLRPTCEWWCVLYLGFEVVVRVADWGNTVPFSSASIYSHNLSKQPSLDDEREGANDPECSISFEPDKGHTSRTSIGTYTVANPPQAFELGAREPWLYHSSNSKSIHEPCRSWAVPIPGKDALLRGSWSIHLQSIPKQFLVLLRDRLDTIDTVLMHVPWRRGPCVWIDSAPYSDNQEGSSAPAQCVFAIVWGKWTGSSQTDSFPVVLLMFEPRTNRRSHACVHDQWIGRLLWCWEWPIEILLLMTIFNWLRCCEDASVEIRESL